MLSQSSKKAGENKDEISMMPDESFPAFCGFSIENSPDQECGRLHRQGRAMAAKWRRNGGEMDAHAGAAHASEPEAGPPAKAMAWHRFEGRCFRLVA